ncbi:MAG: 30S ribosome-binding factor RbfA [Acidimicrobiia bacterium]
MARRGSHGTSRQYPRTARLNELLREILADELERSDDDRLHLVTVTAVEIEGDLRHAVVYFDSLEGEDGDEAVLDALGEVRWRLQGAIGRQARMKRTPELSFRPDPAVREGARIESLLAAGDRPVDTESTPPTEADDPAS